MLWLEREKREIVIGHFEARNNAQEIATAARALILTVYQLQQVPENVHSQVVQQSGYHAKTATLFKSTRKTGSSSRLQRL